MATLNYSYYYVWALHSGWQVDVPTKMHVFCMWGDRSSFQFLGLLVQYMDSVLRSQVDSTSILVRTYVHVCKVTDPLDI